MFQAEPILWLQSFESPAITSLLLAVSLLGYAVVYTALIIGLAFGCRLRPSLAVLLALIISGILTNGFKEGLAIPRPNDIDTRVSEPGEAVRKAVGTRGAARGFWALPSAETTAAVRARPEASYGFPSGHVSSAAAFFVGAGVFFRFRAALIFALGWIPLMAVSRMYLGRHFLADVVGGVAVGLVAVVVAAVLLRPLNPDLRGDRGMMALAPLGLVVLLFTASTPFVAALDAQNVGRLLGLTVVYAFVLRRGFPFDRGAVWQRSARILVAIIVYLATSRIIDTIWDVADWQNTRSGDLVAGLIVTSVTLGGAIALSRRLRLFRAA
ncbi:MAG: phosphatase PAP2 family protein [Acidobacteriota bacterium]|nr:MAG: phosphatase PAP2 family protein [Acidobacteriota bacterium]